MIDLIADDQVPFGRPVIIYGKKEVKQNAIPETIITVSMNTSPNSGKSKRIPEDDHINL